MRVMEIEREKGEHIPISVHNAEQIGLEREREREGEREGSDIDNREEWGRRGER